MRALAIAATGMNAQETNVEVIANNIANVNTTGYKRARAEFTDLLYQVERAQGVAAQGAEGVVPEGAQLGLGVRLAAIRNVHLQGSLRETGNKLDLAINGQGWFQIQGPGGDTLYSRDGAFNTNAQGQLVTLDGFLVEPNITMPANTTEVVVNSSGEVFARVENELQTVGNLSLVTFANDAGLHAEGGNLFRETVASGAPVAGIPGDPGYGVIHQGYLEDSNVDPIKEISELISAQRAYEMNSKVISAADEMASVVSKGIR
ncbi:flagellar basal-body rod protein FlgG [Fulvimarina manganoxydans]|uniref:Flagellar basal-body rod protein FlgG n=1 Tax=Fulvimarina manganoxydans TaxID=937218 RepID=A0A1W1YL18_9HYPH|nr:flagellar basal-body rod protein FlgG [Fulvimarina manganoxydans]MCK5933244.1 flagellar basal-body rod protein FlgG [Fulvimarina manganoxydans]MEE2950474.1 flagellar basal-body rod protein FlgG [Pseudomonadota bacterium]SMC36428.1 flagellar basal-body rod protein FlgG [Fulvimarina manganoxydans]